MEHHDHNNGHGDNHDDHATEGNRQYYPQGWWMPLAGLVVVVLGFAIGAYFVLGVSGTDKWGKKEQCAVGEHEGGHHDSEHHDAHGGPATNHENDRPKEGEGLMAPGGQLDSMPKDSAAKHEEHHDHENAPEHH